MYKTGSLVTSIVFDVEGASHLDFFSMARVVRDGTSYTDLYPGQTHNYFSIEG